MHRVILKNGKIEWVTSEVLYNLQTKGNILFIIDERDGSLDGYFDPLRLPIPD
jgi:hypothetical protein